MTDEAYANGQFVAQFLNNGSVPDKRIQPNGVDLGFDEIYRSSGIVEIGSDDYEKARRTKMRPKGDGAYRLYPGVYNFVYDYEIEIPEGYVGHVYPRSRIMRSGLHLTTALWDSGYEGIGEGMLVVPRSIQNVKLHTDAEIAQMTFQNADVVSQYDGTHQSERIEAE